MRCCKSNVSEGFSLRNMGEGLESDYGHPEYQAEGYEERDESRGWPTESKVALRSTEINKEEI